VTRSDAHPALRRRGQVLLRLVASGAALALAACAAAAPEARQAEGEVEAGFDEEAEPRYRYEPAPDATPATKTEHDSSRRGDLEDGDAEGEEAVDPTEAPGDDAPPLASDPHTERPGSEERGADRPTGPTKVQLPSAPHVVPRAKRPPLPGRARLAVAFVQEGRLAGDPAALLSLEGSLVDEDALALVVALPAPARPRADLQDLAAAAKAAGHHLLLVDVRHPNGERDGYLLHVGGALLARIELPADDPTPTPASGADGLPDRLARAYARWAR
jgi:hypothetical protein